jgi:hypothetical protein
MKLQKLQNQLDEKKKIKNQKITIDFAGRKVYNDQEHPNDRL